MINRLAFVLAGIGAVIVFFGGHAHACSCEHSDRPLRSQVVEAKAQADAVFIGKVLTVIENWDVGYTSVELKVINAWKGAMSETIIVLTGIDDGNCRVQFKTGDTYLIYANNNSLYSRGGALSTGICHRTAKLSDAKSDLKYLRRPTKVKLGNRNK